MSPPILITILISILYQCFADEYTPHDDYIYSDMKVTESDLPPTIQPTMSPTNKRIIPEPTSLPTVSSDSVYSRSHVIIPISCLVLVLIAIIIYCVCREQSRKQKNPIV